MKFMWQWAVMIFASAALCSVAEARCTINAAGLTVSPATVNTGTFTPPGTPSTVTVTFNVSGTYNSTTATRPTCGLAIAFNRGSIPASMTRTTGGATMSYTVLSGASSLLYTGGAPTTAQTVQTTFNQAGTNLTNQPFTATLSVNFLASPSTPQGAGSYSDSLTLNTFYVRVGGGTAGAMTALTSTPFTVTATVNKACTIGGVATPAADSATIPVSTTGTVTTTAIPKSYATVVCNVLSNVQVSSLSGAVKSAATAPSGFTNLINYSASAIYSGATSTLNTATVATAAGVELGTSATTTSATSSGTLSVTITPQTPTLKLIKGSYSDTLRITITPQ